MDVNSFLDHVQKLYTQCALSKRLINHLTYGKCQYTLMQLNQLLYLMCLKKNKTHFYQRVQLL